MACQEQKDAHKVQFYELPKIGSIGMAAEPFELYKWEGFDQSICDFFGGDKTILIGCYKGKKYEDWIHTHNIYTILDWEEQKAQWKKSENSLTVPRCLYYMNMVSQTSFLHTKL